MDQPSDRSDFRHGLSTSRAWRAAARLIIVVPAALTCWVIVRAVAPHNIAEMVAPTGLAGWVPGRDATLVLATFLIGALVVEVSADRGGTTPGLTGSITALIGAVVLPHLPRAVAVMPVELHRWRWAGLLTLAVALLSVALADHGRAKLLRRRRSEAPRDHATAGRDSA